MDNKNSYKTILKSTSIFGSVQLVTIVTAIIKSKIVATLIGSYGYGVYSVLIHTSDLIKQISLVGIDVSGVRKIAEENSTKNENELQYNIAVISKLVLISSFIGFILATTLSLFLSAIIFSTTGTFGKAISQSKISNTKIRSTRFRIYDFNNYIT